MFHTQGIFLININLTNNLCLFFSKENTALRAGVQPHLISVIPNAVDAEMFKPDLNRKKTDHSNLKLSKLCVLTLLYFLVTIVVVSRLVYRKGVDLLAGLIPIICEKYPNIRFLVGGDGPKRIVLEEVIERHQLQDRVTLLGALNNGDVRDVLVQGDIFLNASLTEAFCMAIVEAAACGLQVVSTKVGGIPEVLPSELIWLTDPSIKGLQDGLERALEDRKLNKIVPPEVAHTKVKEFYKWDDVSRRTQLVYDSVINDPVDDLGIRLHKLWRCGVLSGAFFIAIAVIVHFLYLFFSWLVPVEVIDIAPELTIDKLQSDTSHTEINHSSQHNCNHSNHSNNL